MSYYLRMRKFLILSDNVDKNKAAIILLSTAANIISRHTSMVGVDRERPDMVTGEMIQSRIPRVKVERATSSLENLGVS